MALRVKPALGDTVRYLRNDGGKWRASEMPRDAADELLRRLDWELDGHEWASHGMRLNRSFVEEVENR